MIHHFHYFVMCSVSVILSEDLRQLRTWYVWRPLSFLQTLIFLECYLHIFRHRKSMYPIYYHFVVYIYCLHICCTAASKFFIVLISDMNIKLLTLFDGLPGYSTTISKLPFLSSYPSALLASVAVTSSSLLNIGVSHYQCCQDQILPVSQLLSCASSLFL